MINIQDIVPFMKKGWVAMDNNGIWCWYSDKPNMHTDYWFTPLGRQEVISSIFDIAPAEDWTKSLIKVGE